MKVLVRASFDGSNGGTAVRAFTGTSRAGGTREPQTRHPVNAGRRSQGTRPKRFKRTTMSDHDDPIAANLLARQFTADAPNQRWVGDTTEFVIGDTASCTWPRFSISFHGSWWAGP